MAVVIAALAVVVAALYGFIGLYIVPRLAALAEDKSSGIIRVAQYGAGAFFLGCAMTHLAIAAHTLSSDGFEGSHALAHLVPHIAQVVGGSAFSYIAWTRLDVRLRTKEEARLEAEGERLREQLERSQRLGSLGQLAGGVAHDFNNLLAVILGYGELLEHKLADRPELRAQVAEIVAAAQRGTDVTRQLLVFSRGSSSDSDSCELKRAIEGSETLLRRAVGESVQLELVLPPEPLPVPLGRGYLEQILLNLSLNARDAMRDGGRLRITAAREGDGVRLTVADTGEGMSQDVAALAFDPFFSTKPAGQGTGLGLSMVHGIIDRAGGHVELESAPGKGTTIAITLPLGPAQEPERVAAPATPAELRGATILVVEDQEPVRAVMRRILADRGARVIEARDGETALELLERHGDEIDLVVTDVVMPGMSGLTLAARIRAERPALPLAFASGHVADELALPEGAVLLRKPFTGAELTGAVEALLPARLAGR